MTGNAMSLIAYDGFTDGMKISDTTSHYNVSMFWQLLSMCIPGAVPQPVISDKTSSTNNAKMSSCVSSSSKSRQCPINNFNENISGQI